MLVDWDDVDDGVLREALYEHRMTGRALPRVLARRGIAPRRGTLPARRRAEAARRSHLIGELLVEAGHVTEADVRLALQIQGPDVELPIGRIMVASG